MRYLVIVSANRLVWPNSCASCMSTPNTSIVIATRKITSRNTGESSWQVPYCSGCKAADESAPRKFGWFKSLFDSFTGTEYAVDYLSLHMTAHKFAFRNKDYLEAFLSQNGGKKRSEVWLE
jgi:hypothetical protein